MMCVDSAMACDSDSPSLSSHVIAWLLLGFSGIGKWWTAVVAPPSSWYWIQLMQRSAEAYLESTLGLWDFLNEIEDIGVTFYRGFDSMS
jgi:hypothetical protein